jgi:hybrid polyketide synthase/nonribosomal peptide synthetase ACE1
MGLNRHFFLIAGKEVQGGNQIIGFSDSLKSCMALPSSSMIKCGQSEKEALDGVLKIYINLLAQSAIRRVSPGKALAVLDPEFPILAALKYYASQMDVQLVLITSNDPSAPSPWIHIHPNSTRRVLHNRISHQVTHFFDADSGRETPSIILQALPKNCEIQTEASLTESCFNPLSYAKIDEVNFNFQSSWEHDIPINSKRFSIHDMKSLIEGGVKPGNQGIVLMDLPNLPIQVLPASKTVRFSKNKTYWLIGLTSGLGISLCEWMVRQGARYIALSSRNPTLDKGWIDSMASRGCTIRAFST